MIIKIFVKIKVIITAIMIIMMKYQQLL